MLGILYIALRSIRLILCVGVTLTIGAAITSGYRLAVDLGIDVVAVMAGDGQMDPNDLTLIIDPVVSGKADYSKGNRLFTGEAWRKTPHVRYRLLLSSLNPWLEGTPAGDTSSEVYPPGSEEYLQRHYGSDHGASIFHKRIYADDIKTLFAHRLEGEWGPVGLGITETQVIVPS